LGAVTSVSLMITGILLPFFSDFSVLLPLLATGIAYLLSTAIMLGVKNN